MSRHVSCLNDRVKYKLQQKIVYEAPIGEYITSIQQYQDKRKCCGKVTGITSKKINVAGFKTMELAYDAIQAEKCSKTQFVGRDSQGRRTCTDCPAEFTRIDDKTY